MCLQFDDRQCVVANKNEFISINFLHNSELKQLGLMVAITSTYVHKESFAERVPLQVEFYANLTLFKEAAKLTEITSLKQAHKKWSQQDLRTQKQRHFWMLQFICPETSIDRVEVLVFDLFVQLEQNEGVH